MSDRAAVWEISPYVGVGPIVLGATRDEVEAALGAAAVLIDKGGEVPTATFSALGVHLHSNAQGSTEAVELMAPARPVLLGCSLLLTPFPEVVAWLREQDSRLTVEVDGVTSDLLGVGMYAPLAHEHPHRPAEGVIVFARGYYDG